MQLYIKILESTVKLVMFFGHFHLQNRLNNLLEQYKNMCSKPHMNSIGNVSLNTKGFRTTYELYLENN